MILYVYMMNIELCYIVPCCGVVAHLDSTSRMDVPQFSFLRFFKQCLETLELGVGVELGVRCHGTLTYGHLMICAEDGAVLVECSYVAVASSVICCTIQENPCGCND